MYGGLGIPPQSQVCVSICLSSPVTLHFQCCLCALWRPSPQTHCHSCSGAGRCHFNTLEGIYCARWAYILLQQGHEGKQMDRPRGAAETKGQGSDSWGRSRSGAAHCCCFCSRGGGGGRLSGEGRRWWAGGRTEEEWRGGRDWGGDGGGWREGADCAAGRCWGQACGVRRRLSSWHSKGRCGGRSVDACVTCGVGMNM